MENSNTWNTTIELISETIADWNMMVEEGITTKTLPVTIYETLLDAGYLKEGDSLENAK